MHGGRGGCPLLKKSKSECPSEEKKINKKIYHLKNTFVMIGTHARVFWSDPDEMAFKCQESQKPQNGFHDRTTTLVLFSGAAFPFASPPSAPGPTGRSTALPAPPTGR